MIGLFTAADHKGLAPEDYDASRWPARVQKLQSSPTDSDLANFDAAMTISTMRFIRALHVGRVNPKTLGRQLNVEKRKYELGEFVYDKVINASDPAEVVTSVEPTFPGYLRTLDALQRYREFAKVDTGKTLGYLQADLDGRDLSRPAAVNSVIATSGRLPCQCGR